MIWANAKPAVRYQRRGSYEQCDHVGTELQPVGSADVCPDRYRVSAATTATALPPARRRRVAFRLLLGALVAAAEAEADQRDGHKFLPAQRGLLAVRHPRAPGGNRFRQFLDEVRHVSTVSGIATTGQPCSLLEESRVRVLTTRVSGQTRRYPTFTG